MTRTLVNDESVKCFFRSTNTMKFKAQQISQAEVVLAFCINQRVVINQRNTIVLSGNVKMNLYILTTEQNNLIVPEFPRT